MDLFSELIMASLATHADMFWSTETLYDRITMNLVSNDQIPMNQTEILGRHRQIRLAVESILKVQKIYNITTIRIYISMLS